ncbi:MAG: hypothetical protein ACOC5G_03170 [Acidobacteriota bacterium]
MLKTRTNFKQANKIYRNCDRCHTSYRDFLNDLRTDDVVLFFVPCLSTFSSKRLNFAKIKTYIYSIFHQINLINQDCMGVYLHCDWVLGRLIKDSILYRIYQEAPDIIFKRYSGEDFYSYINNQSLSKKQFNDKLQKFIKSGRDLGPGMKYKYLSKTSSEDPIIAAGLRRINNKIYPTVKAFYGSRSKPAVYGNLKQLIKPIHNKSLSDFFVDLCIKGSPVKVMDVATFSAAKVTPMPLLSPNKFFSTYSTICISRTMACIYETLNSMPEKNSLINKKMNEIYVLCNNFHTPIPRESFFLFFKNLFNRCYKI